ncbi:MAG: DoxX family protein [Bacteroidota bacterium]
MMSIDLQTDAILLLLLLFLIITFLQSGLDKLFDFKGNLAWLQEHFSKTVFKSAVPLLLSTITIMELATAILAIIGSLLIVLREDTSIAMYAAIMGSLTLLMLLLGQRMAKDYEGAKTIVIYFVPCVFLLFLLT